MRSKYLVTLALALAVSAAGCGAGRPNSAQPAPSPAPLPEPSPAISPPSGPAPSPAPLPAAQESPAPAPTVATLPSKGFAPRSIAFWDAEHGLLAGSAGCPDHCQGIVAVTSDGGKSWRVAYQGGTGAGSTAVAPGGHGWATVSCDAGDPCKGTLLRTTDWGKSWRASPQDLRALSFADASTGWAMTGSRTDPVLLATVDAGLSWQPVASPCVHYSGSDYPARPSATRGWVACAGQPGAGQQPKEVYATTDGGKTWQEVGNPGWGGYLQGLSMLADGHGWLWQSRGNLTATADGGKTWVDIGLTRPEELEAVSAWLVSDRVGFVLLQDNGRRTWTLAKTGDGTHFAAVQSWPID